MRREVAALLNFMVWGAGYLYIGDRMGLGGLLVAGYLPIHWYWLTQIGAIDAVSGPSVSVLAGHLFLSTGLAYDAYTSEPAD